ncbi:MAG TPA: DUF2087 domain-containing protein [Azospirillaceae bacterium]|nr:DUF2087 domain-containing protein [Azospirillaceae bacterium]
MSRSIFPYHAADISAVAKSLRQQIGSADQPPGHVEMLNMLARAAGFRNFQHFRADQEARAALEAPPAPEPVDHVQVRRLAGHFDDGGRLLRWPSKYSQQVPCLWVLWSRIEARRPYTEAEINEPIRDNHLFGDHAILRRELVNHGLLERTPDGRVYRRVEREPPAEARALIRHLAARRASSSSQSPTSSR